MVFFPIENNHKQLWGSLGRPFREYGVNTRQYQIPQTNWMDDNHTCHYVSLKISENRLYIPEWQFENRNHSSQNQIDRSCLGCLHTTVMPSSFRLACVQPASAALECLQCSHCRRRSKVLPVLYPADLVPWLQFSERLHNACAQENMGWFQPHHWSYEVETIFMIAKAKWWVFNRPMWCDTTKYIHLHDLGAPSDCRAQAPKGSRVEWLIWNLPNNVIVEKKLGAGLLYNIMIQLYGVVSARRKVVNRSLRHCFFHWNGLQSAQLKGPQRQSASSGSRGIHSWNWQRNTNAMRLESHLEVNTCPST